MKPPTFFLSSTVYDFKDLRSAIKYHLERQGCRVLASEFNDFRKPLDRHSYEACLHSIQEADWFILLIGTRVGGWYDEAARISITQQEYREAYRLHQQGRLKILTFVRSEVWQMKEERKQLAKHVDELKIEPALKAKIENYPSKSADDAAFISAFINEVGRNKETRESRATGGALPTGNWIHVFETFGDIADAIQLQPFAGRPVEETALRRLLRRELQEILRLSLVKPSKGMAYSPLAALEQFCAHHPINKVPGGGDQHWVDVELFDQLCSQSIATMNMHHRPRILGKAIESSAFLRLDNLRGTFTEEPVYVGLLKLADELRRFEQAKQKDGMKVVFENTPRARPRHSKRIDVSGFDLVMFLHMVDRWCNVIILLKAIIRNLDGIDFAMPLLRPNSPIQKENEHLQNEDATEADLEYFLNYP